MVPNGLTPVGAGLGTKHQTEKRPQEVHLGIERFLFPRAQRRWEWVWKPGTVFVPTGPAPVGKGLETKDNVPGAASAPTAGRDTRLGQTSRRAVGGGAGKAN